MKVKIFGSNPDTDTLFQTVKMSLEELWLSDFVEIEKTSDEELKNSLKISKEPALVIEEESIDFRDTIFEWMIPPQEELKSMFISIVWGSDGGGCGTGCGTDDEWASCGTWCSCH